MTRTSYPVVLTNLHELRCVVVGGGPVAERKVEGLLEAGASITVISPALTDRLQRWLEQGRFSHIACTFQVGDLEGAMLAIAATGTPAVNAQVAQAARDARILVNVVDDPNAGNFNTVATVRQGDLLIGISTGAAGPAVAALVRRKLERLFGPEYGSLLALLGALRRGPLRQLPQWERRRIWRELASDKMLNWLRLGQRDRVEAYARDVIQSAQGPEDGASPAPVDASEDRSHDAGFVSLVGAGPGDPDLISIKGMLCLQGADAVVYDYLANDALLAYCPAHIERYDVGKQAGAQSFSQDAINELLVTLARQGKRVVRLKGGDPFMFGRGGEEAEALLAAGISWEMAPGISSGLAAPAYAGIPLTHRDAASSVVFVTGHEKPGRAAPRVDWQALAGSVDTIVVFMGIGNLQHICESLMAGGRPPSTPVAAIRWGTLPRQQTVVGTLATIAEDVAAAGLASPAIVVVGEVVRLRERLHWFEAELAGYTSDAESGPAQTEQEEQR